MADIPPPPTGFTIDGAADTIPPPPTGFAMDNAQAATPVAPVVAPLSANNDNRLRLFVKSAKSPDDIINFGKTQLGVDIHPDEAQATFDYYNKGGKGETPIIHNDAPPVVHGEQDQRPTSFLQGVGEGIAKVANNGAAALESGANVIGLAKPLNALGSMLGMAPSEADAENTQNQYFGSQPTQGSTLGHVVGNVLPLLAIPGGPIAQGAIGGALSTDDRSLGGVAQSAGIGAVAGKVGDMAANGLSRLVSPVVSPVVKRMQDAGIRLTPGQIAGASDTFMGNMAKSVEDKLTSVPFVGDAIKNARIRSIDDFNRGAVGQVLAPIGETLPKSVGTGFDAVKFAGDKLSGAYQKLLPNISATADEQFTKGLADVAEHTDTLTADRANQFAKIMQADVGRFFNKDGSIDGEGLKQIEGRLGSRIRNFSSTGDPDARDMATALRAVQGEVRDMIARQNPAEAPQLQAINQGWAQLTRVENAASKAKDGIYSPQQFGQAVRQGDSSARKRAVARGEALMQQYSEDAKGVLPSTTPNSGTADRWLLGAGGVGLMSHNPVAQVGGAAALAGAGLYSRPGVAAAKWALTGRQGPGAKAVASFVKSLAPVASAGAVAAASNRP